MKKKYVLIIALAILLIAAVIVVTFIKNNSYLDCDEYKKILVKLGYEESEIYDQKFDNGELKRWVGLSDSGLYACLFDYDSKSAAELKKEDSAKYFSGDSSRKILYSEIIGKKLIIIAADEEHEDEANEIIENIK